MQPPRRCTSRGIGPAGRSGAGAAALHDLPMRQREVIALRYYAELSEAETAATVASAAVP